MSCYLFSLYFLLTGITQVVYHASMNKAYYTTKRQVNRFLALGLSVTCLSGIIPTHVKAQDKEVIKTSISNATYLLEDAIQKSWNEAENEVRKAVVSQGLDYRLTMDSFYEQDNPYLETDYLELITAYMIAKKYSDEMEKSDLYSLPFIQLSINVDTAEEYEPKEVPVYQSRDGTDYEVIGTEYIYEPIEEPVYRKISDNTYEMTEDTQMIELESKEVNYGEISLCGLSYKDILTYFNVNTEKCIDEFKKTKAKLESIVSGKGLSESVFIQTMQTGLITQEISEYLRTLNDADLTYERKALIRRALTLVGRVPYEWGGKAKNGDYDNTWWTIKTNGKQKGLDCSGFVQWCFMDDSILPNLSKIENLVSTQTMLKNTKQITMSELEPGDLGFLHSGNAGTTNHVGIYLGNHYWVHCSSGAKTVTVEQTEMFKVFREMPEYTEENETEETKEIQKPKETTSVYEVTPLNHEYTDKDIMLLAQLVYNEANTEGLNGWIAVAEVVKNRVNSPLFPNTIEGVVYQKNPVQFENYQMIAKREPREEQISVVRQVLEGTLGVLNNDDVLYFRNAKGSEADWTGHSFYTSVNHHQFYTQQ